MPTRRQFLYGCSAAAGLSLTRPAVASGAGADTKFIFVVNYGGWDPTRVFASEFNNPQVDMERSAGEGAVGDLVFVEHADRPDVSGFFERHADRAVILNGLLVPSVAHENCLHLAMTGTSASTAPDWPAIIASRDIDRYALPHLVVDGPSFPGDLGGVVTRTGSSGQLEALLSGDIIGWSDLATSAPGSRAEDILDRYVSQRVGAEVLNADYARHRALNEAYQSAMDRSMTLKGLLGVVDWGGGTSFTEQLSLAVDALNLGISRCVTVAYSSYSWDTHTNNDADQSRNFEDLFSGLIDLMDRLEAADLTDETVVVVLSEMGRTPQLNATDGKDHWPYSSALVVGPGLLGGRTVGGFDSYYYGRRLDLGTGDFDDDGRDLGTDVMGATLLRLAGLDNEAFLPGVGVLEGILR